MAGQCRLRNFPTVLCTMAAHAFSLPSPSFLQVIFIPINQVLIFALACCTVPGAVPGWPGLAHAAAVWADVALRVATQQHLMEAAVCPYCAARWCLCALQLSLLLSALPIPQIIIGTSN